MLDMRSKELRGQSLGWMVHIDFKIGQDGGMPYIVSLGHT